jgi:excisionase family DNA binding protein
MGRTNGNSNHVSKQPELFADVFTPTITVRQPDGSLLVKAGKPQLVEPTISTAEAAALLGISQRNIQKQCEDGDFKTAVKPGKKTGSRWRIARSEVMARRIWRPE